MSSPGLKATVQLRGDGGRQELLDESTKRTLALSPLEARLLGLWDGLCSATHLTDVARAHGVVIEARQAAVFLERLGRAGFLAATPNVDSGLVPDAPGLERLEDRVPKLRGDLLIAKSLGGKGVLQVTDPLKGRSFTLYDFEVSIARLLDGRRTAGQLLDSAGRLGIPVNLESLRKFVRQLRGYRFIDELAAAPHPANEVPPAPEAWTTELRELYDTALRFWRQDKVDHALEYLTALLEVSPTLEEPRELKARLEALRAGEVEVEVNFDSLHGVPNPLVSSPAAALPAMDFMALHSRPPDLAAAPSPPAAAAGPLDFAALLTDKSPSAPAPEAQKKAVTGSHPVVVPPAASPPALAAQKKAVTGSHPVVVPPAASLPAPDAQKKAVTGSHPVAVPPAPSHDAQKKAVTGSHPVVVPPAAAPAAQHAVTSSHAAPLLPVPAVDFMALHSSPASTAPAPGATPAPVSDSMVVDSTPAGPVPFATPSQMLSHGEDPFRLYEPGIVVPAAVPEGPPVASMPSLIIDEDLGATTTEPADPGSSLSVLNAFAGFAAEQRPGATDSAPREPAAPPAPAPTSPPQSEPADQGLEARPTSARAPPGQRTRRALLAGGGLLLVALVVSAVWLLRPVPRHASLPCRLEALEIVTVVAPWAGAIAPPAAGDAATVKPGQPLGAMDDGPAQKRLAAIARRQEAITAKRSAVKAPAPKALKAATAKADALRKANAAAEAKLARAEALPPAQRKAAVAKQKKAAATVKLKLRRAEAALEALTHAAELARLSDEAQTLETEATALREALSKAALVSPIAGRVSWLVKPGEPVEAGAPVARVDPGRWLVRAESRLKLPPGVPVEATVTVGAASLEVRRLEVQETAVQGLVDSFSPLPATGTLEISAGERQAYELLFGEE